MWLEVWNLNNGSSGFNRDVFDLRSEAIWQFGAIRFKGSAHTYIICSRKWSACVLCHKFGGRTVNEQESRKRWQRQRGEPQRGKTSVLLLTVRISPTLVLFLSAYLEYRSVILTPAATARTLTLSQTNTRDQTSHTSTRIHVGFGGPPLPGVKSMRGRPPTVACLKHINLRCRARPLYGLHLAPHVSLTRIIIKYDTHEYRRETAALTHIYSFSLTVGNDG